MSDDITELLDNKLPSQMDEDDCFKVLQKWYIADMRANSPWYSEARTDYGYESGDQYDEEEKAKYRERDRIYVTMNRVKPTVDVICGMEVTNRQEVTYLPRTTAPAFPEVDPKTGQMIPVPEHVDDGAVTEGYSEVARWARDNCDAEDEESDSFRDTVISGMGWTQTLMEYEDDPEGKIIIDRKDPLTMGWEHTSTKRNLDDSRRFHETKWDVPVDVAHHMFPDRDIGDLHAGWAFDTRLGEGYEHDRELAKWYENKNIGEDASRSKVTLVIIEWCEVHTAYEVYNPADNTPFTVSQKEFSELQKNAKKAGVETITHRQVKQKKWMRATIGRVILEMGPAPCDTSSSYKCITGYRDRNKHQWYGIVRPMRDPQKWANKFFSVALEQIATSGKGIMAEEGAFVDDKKAEQEWSKTGNISWMKTGAISSGKVMPKPQPPMLTGLSELMQLSLNGIRDVTGVNQETIGLAERDQAASLEYQRRQAGVTILAAFFDNLRRYRKEQGRVLLYFIQHYISDGRLIRILGENGTPKVIKLIKQPDTITYDVIVDQAPSSPNQKEAAWLVTQQLLPLLTKIGAPPQVMLEILKGSPLPESNVQRIQRAWTRAQEEQAQQGPSLEEQKLQADIGKVQADAQKSLMDGQLKQQELQIRGVEAQFALQQTQMTLEDGKEQRGHDIQMRQMDMDQRKMELSAEAGGKEAEALGPQMPGMVNSLGEGLKALAQAIVQANQMQSQELRAGFEMLAQTQAQLAQVMSAPKQAVLSPDGMSATVIPARLQ